MAKSKDEEDEAAKADGLEIISIGRLYKGPWDKKYWSSSRVRSHSDLLVFVYIFVFCVFSRSNVDGVSVSVSIIMPDLRSLLISDCDALVVGGDRLLPYANDLDFGQWRWFSELHQVDVM